MTLSIAQFAQVSDWFSTGVHLSTKTITGLNWSDGDYIVVVGGIQKGQDGASGCILNVTHATQVFSLQQSANIAQATESVAQIWRSVAVGAGTAETLTVLLNCGAGSLASGAAAWVVTGGPTGVTNADSSNVESPFTEGVGPGSVVISGLMDFNATNPPGKTPLTGSGTATERRDVGDGTTYAQWLADWVNTSSGTFSFGPNNYTSLAVGQVLLEVTAPPPPPGKRNTAIRSGVRLA